MARRKKAHQNGDESVAKGPSHERHKRRRLRKLERERMLRDKWVTEVWGRRGHGACGRKVRFRCRHEASQFVEHHRLRRPVWAYRCRYCGGWHITSHPEADSVEV